MGIIVQLGHSQCLRIKGNWVKLAISTGDGEDSGDHIVQSIGFNSDLCARLEVSKNASAKWPTFAYCGKASLAYMQLMIV